MKTFFRYLAQKLRIPSRSLATAGVLAVAMCATTALAQSGAGSIQGTVTDSTGAVIPDAIIKIVNTATGVSSRTKSTRVGFYQVPGLFTGSYTVSVTVPNMKTYTKKLDLLAGQTAVIDPVMTAGQVTEQVTVAASAVQLTNLDDATINSTLEATRIEQLPENGRSISNLAQATTPGLEYGGERANGLMYEATSYVADGVTTNSMHYGSVYNSNVQIQDPDSVQQVQMEMNNASAQYSSPATSVITTKSGTNGLHGTFFETAKNNALGIAKRRQDAPNFSAPQLIRNEFGASAGGPIILPHVYHGKDKSFWFYAYERYSQAQKSSASFSVPTMAMRGGDFSGLSYQGQAYTLYDPSTTTNSANCAATGTANPFCRTPFPNNKIPIGKISPTAKILYDLVPQPTNNLNPEDYSNYSTTVPIFQVIQHNTFRLDHVFDEKDRAYLRFSSGATPMNTITTSSLGVPSVAADGIPAGAAEGYENNPIFTFFTSLGYTHVFSPTFYAETILGQQWLSSKQLLGTSYDTNFESMLGLPNNFGEPGFPATTGLINNYLSSQTDTLTTQITSNIDENLTKVVEKHQIHFGGRFQHIRMADRPQGLADSISFGSNATGIYDTTSGQNYGDLNYAGIGDASFFLGSASSYTINQEPPHDHYHVNEIDAYFQDDYHVSRKLTLNLGLRYEAHPSVWTKFGLNNSFDFKNDAMVLEEPPAALIAAGYTTQAIITNDENIGVKFETPAEAGMPATLLKNYNLNFLPRVGFTYQVFGGKLGTVIRGGYGRYDYQTAIQGYLNHPEKNNPLIATYSQSYSAANQAIDGLPNELLRYNAPVVFGVMGTNTSNVVNSSTTSSILPGISLWTDTPNWAPMAVTEANFTVEQPLKGNSVLRVSWVWTHATNLDITHYFNNHPSTYQWEMAKGVIAPTGGASVIGTSLQNTYAATATGPYDQTTWGSGMQNHTEAGWSNDNALQVNYQRLFHKGFAYQVSYVFSRAMAAGGDTQQSFTGTSTYPYAGFPGAMGTVATMTQPWGAIGALRPSPPTPPSGVPAWAAYHDLIHWELYSRDTNIPYHHVKFNGVIDMPFGRGKRFFGNVNRLVDEMIGGFQIAGNGGIVSQAFGAPTGSFGHVNPIQVYKHKYPIQDCRGGTCYKAYMWFNGYLSPKVTQGVAGSVCTTNCITGLPASYVPAVAPIDNDPTSTYFGANEVQITAPNLNGGKATNIVYDAGPASAAYYAKTFINGPWNWSADASLFKVFPITEKVNLRANVDAFNAFNVQGYNNPGSNGVEEVQPGVGQDSSYNAPRQIQLTVRLTF